MSVLHPGDGDQDQQKRELEERVQKARIDPSSGLREDLLKEHTSYITKVASRICRRPITDRDDEFSVAFSGFNEAITRFEPNQQSSFLSFAYLVIQRRLTDFYRREQKHLNQVPLVSPGSRENESNHPEVVTQSFDRYREGERRDLTRMEVAQFSKALARYGIKLSDLVEASPKHRDTRRDMLEIARKITEREDLLEMFLHGKRVGKEIAEKVGCHRRTLKRNRVYLKALVLVLVEDLPLIRQYLDIPVDGKGGALYAKGNRHGSWA
ncbi:sigma-70 family RNA polymerase sigma factor [Salinithrix halophila]|uniref:RNA polymerase sigma factor SigI n=1 Tax=Salinithrix halophila TaxID=1485204 RepID=A0ABV8JD18_9BACL